MRIIGIDPGTGRLGFGVIDVTAGKPKLVDAGVITTAKNSAESDRLIEIFENLSQIIEESKPDIMAVEKLFFAQNVTTAINVAQARG